MTLHGQWKTASVTEQLTEVLTTVATIPTAAMERLHVSLDVSNDSSIDQFVIQIKPHKDSGFIDAYSTSADYTTPTGILIGVSEDLSGLSAGATGFFLMDVRGIYQVNIKVAQATGDTTTLTIYVGGT